MQNIIYKSRGQIPWDTQSAFKATNYKSRCEEHMVYCYLKSYVHGADLVICTYCFTAEPEKNADISLYLNLNPELGKTLCLNFGFDNLEDVYFTDGEKISADGISLECFKANDEQGFYWCGQITIGRHKIKQLFDTVPEEKSVITINFVKTFENGDFCALAGAPAGENYKPEDNFETFVILNY